MSLCSWIGLFPSHAFVCSLAVVTVCQNTISQEKRKALPEDTRPVIYAGFTFTGVAADIKKNFKYSQQVNKTEGKAGQRGLIDTTVHKSFQKNRDQLRNKLVFRGEEGNDVQSPIQLALALTSESIAQDLIRGTHKLTVQLIFQILILDFRSKEVMATFPFKVSKREYKDARKGAFTDDEITGVVRMIYDGKEKNEKTGEVLLYGDLKSRLKDVRLASRLGQNIRIYKVKFADRCKRDLPKDFIENVGGLAEYGNLTAQKLSLFTQTYLSVAVLPYAKDTANANMALNFADQSVVQFKIPNATYGIDLDVQGFKKMHDKKNSNSARQLWMYGAYINVKVYDPDFGDVYYSKRYGPKKTTELARFYKTKKNDFDETYLFNLALESIVQSGLSQMKADKEAAKIIGKCAN